MERCEHCGGALRTRVLRVYEDDLLGLPGVVLLNAVQEAYCVRCRTVAGITIPDLAGLLAAVAVARVHEPARLRGADVRFLRRALGWNAKTLAARLGVRAETVSRWENEKERINSSTEKYLRLLVGLHLSEQGHLIDFDRQAIEEMTIVPAPRGGRPLRLAFRLIAVAGRGRAGIWEAKKAA